jgi:hypothetical protein
MGIIDKVKKLVVDKFVMGYVKSGLDKLPLDGYKTLISVVLLTLTVVAGALPEYAPFLLPIIELLRPYSEEIQNVAIGTAITGIVHKVLKYFEKKKE